MHRRRNWKHKRPESWEYFKDGDSAFLILAAVLIAGYGSVLATLYW